MDSVLQMVGLLILVLCSAFFSISEISLAAAKNVRLQGLSEAGDQRAREVIALKANPGPMFTIVEIREPEGCGVSGGVAEHVNECRFVEGDENILPKNTAG